MLQSDKKEKRHGFRNLKDMFAVVREQEAQRSDQDTDALSESSLTQTEAGGTHGGALDDDDDELTSEQQRKLYGDILKMITSFVKANNLSEHEYFGVTKQAL